jgi:hypothetical protein
MPRQSRRTKHCSQDRYRDAVRLRLASKGLGVLQQLPPVASSGWAPLAHFFDDR